MKGLILKDFYNLRKQAGTIFIILVMYIAVGLVNDNASIFIGLLMMIAAMLPLTALAYDERSGWDRLALTMPVTRRDVIAAKYGLTIIVIGCASLISLLPLAVLDTPEERKIVLVTVAMILAFCLFYTSLLLPIALKVGVEKARYGIFLVVLLPIIIVVVYSQINPQGLGGSVGKITEESLTMGVPVALAVAIVCLLISYIISVKIYEQKEF